MSDGNGLDLLGLSKPLEKLIDVTSGAIGCLYEPHKIKKNADAHAYQIEKIGNSIKQLDFNGEIEVDGLKVKFEGKKDPLEIKSLITSEVQRIFRERENICKIADVAYDELKNNNIDINVDIDYDWSQFFFDTSRKVYNEDIQFIFGKILAGEIKEPGNYSKRLIEILAKLSQKEAEIFQKISKYVFRGGNDSFILADNVLLKDSNISYNDILLMEEAGLLNSNYLNYDSSDGVEFHDYYVGFGQKNVHFDVYALTKSGDQLERLIHHELDLDYLRKVKEIFRFDNMSYATIVSSVRSDDGIEYSLKDGHSI